MVKQQRIVTRNKESLNMSPDNIKSLRIDIEKQRSTSFAGQERFDMEE
jgi:hypothetical protein